MAAPACLRRAREPAHVGQWLERAGTPVEHAPA